MSYGALYDAMDAYVHYIHFLWGAAPGQFPDVDSEVPDLLDDEILVEQLRKATIG